MNNTSVYKLRTVEWEVFVSEYFRYFLKKTFRLTSVFVFFYQPDKYR